jgi:hypothetical protein
MALIKKYVSLTCLKIHVNFICELYKISSHSKFLSAAYLVKLTGCH